jgi:hypothetical protein
MVEVKLAPTVMAVVAFDIHPVEELVNVNVALPLLTPVTTPLLVTVATALLLLLHVPPDVGDNVVVVPTHIVVGPVTLTVGFPFTVTAVVALEIHPVELLVKVNVALPAVLPVTIPPLVTVATALLLLLQVPPIDGESVVVASTHIGFGPVIETVGLSFTVIVFVDSFAHAPEL